MVQVKRKSNASRVTMPKAFFMAANLLKCYYILYYFQNNIVLFTLLFSRSKDVFSNKSIAVRNVKKFLSSMVRYVKVLVLRT